MPKDPGTSAVILKEIPRWQSRGIVSAAQAKKIREMYGAGKVKQGEAGSRLVPFMAIFGAIMIGAGIILFFAMNWATIPRWVKVGAILAAMIASYHIGYVILDGLKQGSVLAWVVLQVGILNDNDVPFCRLKARFNCRSFARVSIVSN